jgi:hypothetical protein
VQQRERRRYDGEALFGEFLGQSRIARLEAESGAWERAQRLRRYLRAARRTLAPADRIEAMLDGQRVDLLALGEQFADQLDPLHPAERAEKFFNRKDPYATGLTYESDEAKLKNFVARVLGGDWRQGAKRPKGSPEAPLSPEAVLFSDVD